MEQNDVQEFDNVINKYIETLKFDLNLNIEYKDTVFAKYNIPIADTLLQELHFAKNGLWDMTFKNCFYLENKFYYFDQEWKEQNLPIEFILYRSILYTISLRRYININILFEKYGLEKYRTLFEKLDNVLQENIRDEKIWEFYSKNTYFDIDGTKQELINIGIRDNAKQMAIENFQRENQKLLSDIQKLQEEKQQLQEENNILKDKENNKLYNKIKKKIKGAYHNE